VTVSEAPNVPAQTLTSPSVLPLIRYQLENNIIHEELEAKPETAYRETWIKEGEEELERQFHEEVFLREAQWQVEENQKFEEDQIMLVQMTEQREAMEDYLRRKGMSFDGRVASKSRYVD